MIEIDKSRQFVSLRKFFFSLTFILSLAGSVANGQQIYIDALQGDFQNWSWGSTIDLSNTTPVQSGSSSIAVTYNEQWAGLYLRSQTAFNVTGNDEFRFQIHGGVGGQNLNIIAVASNGDFITGNNITLQAGTWTEVTMGFDEIGSPPQISGFVLQSTSPNPQATYYVDQIEIVNFTGNIDGPSIQIDPSVVVREIDPKIYGLNFADPVLATEIGLPINRWGGNSTSRYDFVNNRTNLAADFFFENHPSGSDGSADNFVAGNISRGTETIMTIGMLDFLPNSSDMTGSYRVSLYGPQDKVNMYRPDHGNGIRLDGTRITNNDPFDTHVSSDETHATAWVNHLVTQFGAANSGGVKYYALGNEPMLWNSTHMDVHPVGASYDEVLATGIRYAEAIKDADPDAQTLGPVLWGWTAYFYSGLDAEPGGQWYLNPLDRLAHNNTPFLPWYLQQMADYEAQNGTRLLDYLDVHFYPQRVELPFSPAGDLATQQLRLRSTRGLWDPTYLDESWINDYVRLIPRMREWIDDNYPGTKLAITEYNWGAHDHINGALAQGEILGIFGREGVDLATLWAPPSATQPAAFAFRMFRNYNGNQNASSRFGDTSILAQSDTPDQVSVFAAKRSADNATTIMLINKTLQEVEVPLTAANTQDGSAEVYVYGTTNTLAIRQLSDVTIAGGEMQLTLEPYSMTLVEVPGSAILLGDVDRNGVVDFLDIPAFIDLLINGQFQAEADINSDGAVDFADIPEFIAVLAG